MPAQQVVTEAKNNPTPRQVLFVDDDAAMLQLLQETFSSLSAGRWEIFCSSTADAALDFLNRRKMDLVVVDVNLPVLDGAQFLTLLGKRFPQVKKVSLTAQATEAKRSACLAAGAELFIEKPASLEGYKSIFAMLDDLMNWTPQEGFQGVLRRVGLPDVIQMECLGRNSSVLEIHNDQSRGRIYIEDGNIIHAACGDLRGESALQRLLALSGGAFELRPFAPPPQKTISGPWEFLLMEAARVRDEMTASAVPVRESPKPAVMAGAPVRVAETLICDGAGQLLYQMDCADVPGRVSWLQEISRRATELARILPLGDFDRLEMRMDGGRAVAQTRADRLVFVAVAQDSSGA